jgi:thymidylate synthase ThyX
MTLLSQDYNPELGYTIPESIKAIGMEEELKKVLDKSTELFKEFKNRYGKTAEYCLTNAHKRRVLISVNPRELYHISRLRMDGHAQWDIRNTANEMIELGKEYAPATFILAGGKDQFKGIKKEVYKDF